jgi:hypothetical protein
MRDPMLSPASYFQKRVLTHQTLRNHNQEFHDTDSLASDDTASTLSYNRPWGSLKARGGRGDLIAQGFATCSLQEIDLALELIIAAWLSGNWEMQWAFWPERDEITFAQCINVCWKVVQEQQHFNGREPHELEPHVARKVCIPLASFVLLTDNLV